MTIPTIQRFWNLLKEYKIELRQIYGYGIIIGVVNLTLPLGIQAIINFLQTGEFTTTWVLLVAFVLVGIAITGLIQVIQLRIVENIQQDLFAKSAFEFSFRLPRITLLELDTIHAPELVNRFFDTLTIQKGLPKILIDFSLATFQIIFGLILLAIYSPFFIILGVALALILWLIFKITGPKGLSTSLVESKFKYQLVHWLEEVARVNKTFKLNGKEKLHLEKTDDIVSLYIKAREKHFKVLIQQFRLFIGFKVILAAGLLILGGYLVFNNQMNIGQFVAAEIIIILIINSIEKVLRVIDTIYDVLTSLEKIGYVTDLELDENKGTALVDNSKGLSICSREINFGFPEENRLIIEDLSFDIASGEHVILEGPPGSGKSLLLQIIAGMHPISDGELYIDGIPFYSYNRESINDSLAMSFPTNQIFDGTFRENVTLGKNIPDAYFEEVIKVLRLDKYLIHQIHGVDSKVDSGGRRLPRSVIQKIHIARLIINKPKLLLMEDPLQFIDSEEKKRIIDYLMLPEHGWTTIVISDFHYWKEKSTRTIDLSRI